MRLLDDPTLSHWQAPSRYLVGRLSPPDGRVASAARAAAGVTYRDRDQRARARRTEWDRLQVGVWDFARARLKVRVTSRRRGDGSSLRLIKPPVSG